MEQGKKGYKLNWYTIALIAVLLVAVGVRLYFFSVYKDQPVWWDESEHLLMAKHIAFGTPITGWNASREVIVPLIFAFFFKLFNSEIVVRFVHLLFSLGGVYLTYLIGKEMFNRKVGLIAAFMMSVFYLNLFFTLRFGLEIIAPFFALLAVYYFWKGYVKKEKSYYIFLAAVFGAIAFMASSKEGLIAVSIFFFLLFTDKLKFLRDKRVWIALVIGIILLLPYMLYYKDTTDSFLPRGTTTAASVEARLSESGWDLGNFLFFMKYFPSYLQLPFLLIFLIGLFYVLINVMLGFDLMQKESGKEVLAYLFLILWVGFHLFTFSFFLGISPGAYGEPRFMIEIFPAIFIITAQGFVRISNWIGENRKKIALIAIISILLIGAFYQLRLADATIKGRTASFLQVKDAALWMKENSAEEDWIITASAPQTTYYAERSTSGPPPSEDEFITLVKDVKPKFMVLSIFEPHPQWYLEWPQKHADSVKPVQAYTNDNDQQALLVIYEFTNYDF